MLEGKPTYESEENGKRLAVLAQVKRGELKLVTAGEVMGRDLSPGQKRVWRRYSNLRGMPGLV